MNHSQDGDLLRPDQTSKQVVTNVHELKRMAELLGVEPERVGVASSLQLPQTLEAIDEALAHIWTLVAKAHNAAARLTGERLIRDLRAQMPAADSKLLVRLAQAHHVTGYVTSLNTHTSEISQAIDHFQQMEDVARLLQDETLLNLALTYHGDMLRRAGKLDQAIRYLEAARDTTPRADEAARGNGIQLLGRAYVQQGNVAGFERALDQAATIVGQIAPDNSTTHSLYCLGTVYEEYGRSYGTLGQMHKALAYIDKAEAELPPTMRWNMLLQTTRTVTLIRGGEFRAGGELAVESAHICRTYGNLRCLERVLEGREVRHELHYPV